jgi:hypothetical protein
MARMAPSPSESNVIELVYQHQLDHFSLATITLAKP